MKLIWIKTGKFTPADNITYSTEFSIYKKYYLAGVEIPFFLSPLEIDEKKVYQVVAQIDLDEWRAIPLCLKEGGKYRNELFGAVRVIRAGDKLLILAKKLIEIIGETELIDTGFVKGRLLKPLKLKIEKGDGLYLVLS